MRISRTFAAITLLIGACSTGLAQEASDTPKQAGMCSVPSGPDRKAVLDALRGPVSSDLGTPVDFEITRSRMCGDWAFVVGMPRKEGGEPIDWSQTVCAGDTSHLVGGLAHRDGMAWSLTDYALCPSDVAWADWPEKHKAPQELFDD
jgi:hypothetical protein